MATDDKARVPAGRREGGQFANENRETAASVSDLAGGEYAPERANPYADGLPEKPAWLPTDSDIEDTEANRESLLSLAQDQDAKLQVEKAGVPKGKQLGIIIKLARKELADRTFDGGQLAKMAKDA